MEKDGSAAAGAAHQAVAEQRSAAAAGRTMRSLLAGRPVPTTPSRRSLASRLKTSRSREAAPAQATAARRRPARRSLQLRGLVFWTWYRACWYQRRLPNWERTSRGLQVYESNSSSSRGAVPACSRRPAPGSHGMRILARRARSSARRDPAAANVAPPELARRAQPLTLLRSGRPPAAALRCSSRSTSPAAARQLRQEPDLEDMGRPGRSCALAFLGCRGLRDAADFGRRPGQPDHLPLGGGEHHRHRHVPDVLMAAGLV